MSNVAFSAGAAATDMSRRDLMQRRHLIAAANNLMMMPPFNDKKKTRRLNRSISTAAAIPSVALQVQTLTKKLFTKCFFYFCIAQVLRERIVSPLLFFFIFISSSLLLVCKLLIWA
jgi:hypothetical protein